MNLFLQQVSVEFADYFVVMQVDKAAWHRSHALKVPENIRLSSTAGLQSSAHASGAYLGGQSAKTIFTIMFTIQWT